MNIQKFVKVEQGNNNQKKKKIILVIQNFNNN